MKALRIHLLWMLFILILITIGLAAFGDEQAQAVAATIATICAFGCVLFWMGVI